MCFHYALTIQRTELEIQFSATWDDGDWAPVYHADGFSFLKMPVITQENPSSIRLFNWGLIPHWVKSKADADKLRAQTLNARSETVFEKPSFRSSITNHRCLIPASGFFEWMDFQKKKYPHYIFMQNNKLFCFAGIYANWTDKETGEMFHNFSILTTDANPMLEKIHNIKKRMPVIIPPHLYKKWLEKDLPAEDIKSFFHPYPDSAMNNYTISKLITSRSSNSNTPEVISPFSFPELAGT